MIAMTFTPHERRVSVRLLVFDDDIDATFKRACVTNELETATDLLEVLEKCHARRIARYGREGRIDYTGLRRL